MAGRGRDRGERSEGSALRDLRRGVRRLFNLGLWGPEVDDAVDWEIEHHIQERADELEAEGYTRPEAEREARRRFGDLEAVRRELRTESRDRDRRTRVVAWLETVWQDLSYGLRATRRNPTFSLGLIGTLGLGIGATVAVFALVDALLLRPLPYRDSHELAAVHMQYDQGWSSAYLPADLAQQWEDATEAFDATLLTDRISVLYTGGTEPQELVAQRVAPDFEEVLGVSPAMGRGLLSEDAEAGAPPVTLVSHSFWRTHLGGEPDALGESVRLNDQLYTVIGVMPRGFKFPEYASTPFWVPLKPDEVRAGSSLRLLVRVADGAMAGAEAQAAVEARNYFEETDQAGSTVLLQPMEEDRGGSRGLRRSVWLLFGAVGLILLVAAVNGSNLLLVRGAGRAREVAVRTALGASKWRVVRQMMIETLSLSLAGAVLAVAVAWLALTGLQWILPDELVFWLPHALEMERRALGFAFATAVTTGLALGLLPALRVTRSAAPGDTGALTASAATAPARSRLRRGLVVIEVALSVILLTGAGLLLNSFVRLSEVDIGVDTDNLALIQIPISTRAQPDSAARSSFLLRLEERVEAIPGVVAATATGGLPGSQLIIGVSHQAEGKEPLARDPGVTAIQPEAHASPDFFDVMGARLLAGRPFRPGDRYGETAIIDEDLARALWPEEEAVGRRFRLDDNRPWLTVVGVMASMQLERRDGAWGDYEILRPFDPTSATGYVTLAVRTASDPRKLFGAFREAVHEIAPMQPIQEIVTAEAAYSETIQLPRFLAVIVTGLAGFALVLAAVGLFGVLAYDVAQRYREIGIRMSLGAQLTQVRRMVVREGMVLAVIGVAFGVAGSLALGRTVESLLFDLAPTDPATYGAVVITLLVTAALASYLPARRATRVDPAEVLRAQ